MNLRISDELLKRDDGIYDPYKRLLQSLYIY